MPTKLPPVYITNTPTGPRLIKAATPVAAIAHAMGSDGYTAEALSGPELAQWLEKGLKIEAAPGPVKHAKKDEQHAAGHPAHHKAA